MNENNNKNVKGGSSKIRLILIAIVVIIVIVLLVRCVGGGCGGKDIDIDTNTNTGGNTSNTGYSFADPETAIAQFTGNYYTGSGTTNTGTLDSSVASGVPEKRTEILGNGRDVVTIMVYICGSDLESGGGAATMDIQEMLKGGVGDNVNLILYTGGTTKWQNRQMSSSVNQIYQIRGNSLYMLEKNAGNKSMTDEDTLSEFIRYCGKNFPANRNMLILWDHGGGSVTGYGSDEKFSYDGTMDLGKLRTALKDGGVSFDFVGFDACLMATVETGLAVSDYADYLIASEEVESGYGWYYTNWLRTLSNNTSIPTVELGKEIVDDFITSSKQSGQGWSGTQSVVDLAELSYTVPSKLAAFATATTELIESENNNGNYKTVSKARSGARSFGESYGIDQVDLVDFAERLGTAEGSALSKAVRSAVKYNNTTRDMTNSYGLSIYFPYSNSKYVQKVESVYNKIGMSSEYTRCVQTFAAMELSGQYISGGSGDPFNSLFGLFGSGDYGDSYYSGNSTGSNYSSSTIYDMLGGLLGGDMGGFSSDYSSSDFSFFRSSNIDLKKISDYLEKNQFDETALEWQKNAEGKPVIKLSNEQWDMVESVCLNVFYDDGEGLIDLGSDNVFDFDKDGNLLGVNDHTWLTIDGHYISYYYDSMTVDGKQYVITGHSPILYNGMEAELIINFDEAQPYGYISGVRFVEDTETPNIGKILNSVMEGKPADLEAGKEAKAVSAVKEGDVIEFLADFYDYKGNFEDQYVLGEAWTVGAEAPVIGNMDVGDGKVYAMYCFTDMYHKQYWTGVIPE